MIHLRGETMGTIYNVKCLPGADSSFGDRSGPERLQALVDARLAEINALMSTYDPASEISRFNASRSDAPFKVSPETLRVLSLAQSISEVTGGAFDITVGPLVNAFGFGAGSHGRHPPDEARLQALRANVGYHLLNIDAQAGTVAKARPGVYVDLAAIAKGYGVDAIAALLEKQGFENYMVEIGGEVRAHGVNVRGVAWRIGVERPQDEGQSIERVISVADVGVATSGDYRNFYMVDGKRLSHTIDPRTGRPIAHHLASVTVVDPACARADALATALMVLGPDEGAALADRLGIRALFLVRMGEKRFNEIESRAFAEWDRTAKTGKETP